MHPFHFPSKPNYQIKLQSRKRIPLFTVVRAQGPRTTTTKILKQGSKVKKEKGEGNPPKKTGSRESHSRGSGVVQSDGNVDSLPTLHFLKGSLLVHHQEGSVRCRSENQQRKQHKGHEMKPQGAHCCQERDRGTDRLRLLRSYSSRKTKSLGANALLGRNLKPV